MILICDIPILYVHIYSYVLRFVHSIMHVLSVCHFVCNSNNIRDKESCYGRVRVYLFVKHFMQSSAVAFRGAYIHCANEDVRPLLQATTCIKLRVRESHKHSMPPIGNTHCARVRDCSIFFPILLFVLLFVCAVYFRMFSTGFLLIVIINIHTK